MKQFVQLRTNGPFYLPISNKFKPSIELVLLTSETGYKAQPRTLEEVELEPVEVVQATRFLIHPANIDHLLEPLLKMKQLLQDPASTYDPDAPEQEKPTEAPPTAVEPTIANPPA